MVRDGVGKICGLIRILPIAGAAVTYRENLGKAAGRGSLKYLPFMQSVPVWPQNV